MTKTISKIYLILLMSILTAEGLRSEKVSKIDSLKQELMNSKHDSSRCKTMNALASQYMKVSVDSFYHYIDAALALSRKTGLSKYEARTKIYRSMFSTLSGRYDSAITDMVSAYNTYLELQDRRSQSAVLNNLGIVYSKLGDYPKALSYYLQAKDIDIQLKDTLSLYSEFINIGNLYNAINDHEKAYKNLYTALDIADHFKDINKKAKVLNNLANIYYAEDNIDKAIDCYHQAIDLYKRVENSDISIALIYHNLAETMIVKNELQKAIEYYEMAIAIREKLQAYPQLASSYSRLATIYLKQNKMTKALETAKKGQEIALKIGSLPIIKLSEYGMANVYSKLGNYKEAYNSLANYVDINDSLDGVNNADNISKLQMQYKYSKKEQEQKLIHESQLQRQELHYQYLMVIAIIGFVLLLAVLYIVYQKRNENNKLTNKNKEIEQINRELDIQKRELETKAKELEKANDNLRQLDEFKQNMTAMLVHDLKNPLVSIIGFSNMEIDDETRMYINQSGKQMMNIVMNVLDVQKFESAKVNLNFDIIMLAYTVSNAVMQVKYLSDEKSIEIGYDVSEKIFCEYDNDIVLRVLINILTNAVKYTPDGGKILIAAEQGPEDVMVAVTDTGEGIPEDKVNLVFDKYAQIKAVASGNARSTGLGLTFCKMAVEAHRGEIGIESKPGRGTTVWFTLNNTSPTS